MSEGWIIKINKSFNMNIMKNGMIILGLTLLLGTWPMVASAQVPGADTRNTIRDARQMMSKERVKLFGEKAVLRLTAALNRAAGFHERVALHASQFSNPKFDETVVEQKLVEATEAIAKGRVAVSAIKTAMDTALTATGAEISFMDVRAKIRDAMASVRIAHLKVVDAIRLIIAAYPPATTTQ